VFGVDTPVLAVQPVTTADAAVTPATLNRSLLGPDKF
jgi:hypothetical protein